MASNRMMRTGSCRATGRRPVASLSRARTTARCACGSRARARAATRTTPSACSGASLFLLPSSSSHSLCGTADSKRCTLATQHLLDPVHARLALCPLRVGRRQPAHLEGARERQARRRRQARAGAARVPRRPEGEVGDRRRRGKDRAVRRRALSACAPPCLSLALLYTSARRRASTANRRAETDSPSPLSSFPSLARPPAARATSPSRSTRRPSSSARCSTRAAPRRRTACATRQRASTRSSSSQSPRARRPSRGSSSERVRVRCGREVLDGVRCRAVRWNARRCARDTSRATAGRAAFSSRGERRHDQLLVRLQARRCGPCSRRACG